MNSVNLTGRLVKEIDLTALQSGKMVAKGTIAVQRKFKNANGEYEADFIDFVSWGKGGELMAQYISKGDQFGITGEIITRTYEKDGVKRKITEINVRDFDFPQRSNKSTNQQNNRNDQNTGVRNNFDEDPFADDNAPIDISSDDLPF